MANGRITLDIGKLRQQAQERVRERKRSESARSLPVIDVHELLHELEVHQVELEMQNEELRESRVELETALARYTELFEFAPIGYATLSLEGVLREINHAGAKLLGRMRSQLLERRFDALVQAEDLPQFQELLQRTLNSEARESCELALSSPEGQPLPVRLLATLLARAEPVILIALEDRSLRASEREPAGTESAVIGVRPRDVARRR